MCSNIVKICRKGFGIKINILRHLSQTGVLHYGFQMQKNKITEENRGSNSEWTVAFATIGLTVSSIYFAAPDRF